jgi:hypothetical protein
MANDSQRNKARATFGKTFFENTKAQAPAKNEAVALQQRANARPIPTYKVGGVVKKQNGGAMSGRNTPEADDVLMSTPRGTRMLEEQRRREREAKAKAEAAKRAKADVLLGIPAQKEGGRANEDFTGLIKKAASRAAAKGNPVMKQGGATRDYIEKRVDARMQAGNYKDGGRAEVRRDRKMLDIEKDYKIALAKGKNEGVAKAKYEQRKADAADDYAKATKADRTATKAAEKSAEATLKEARRTKGISIDKRDAGEAFMQKNSKEIAPKMDVSSTLKGVAGLGTMPSAAPKAAAPKVAAPARNAPVVRQARPAASAAPAPARPAAARPAAPVGSPQSPAPANPKEDIVVTAKKGRDNTAAGRRERLGDVISSVNPFRAIARGIDSVLTAGTGPSKSAPRTVAAKPDASKAAAMAKNNERVAKLRAAGNERDAKFYEKYPTAMKRGGETTPVKRAAGGAGKVRKGQMKGC